VYTLRGARVRDPLSWSKYLDESIQLWGSKSEVMYGMHHWPVWGNGRVLEMLTMARDGYRFINDQTLRLANRGYTPVEIGEMIQFPKELAQHWAMRAYYGTISHNVKATYDRYLGWFDGNPANLHTLPPEEVSKKYVEFMGGAEAVLRKAKIAFSKGEYRWVAEAVNHVVFADPDNQAARALQADTLEQLGYQSESGPWRNFYLTGAQELREGVKQFPTVTPIDIVTATSFDMFFDFLGILLDGPRAAGKKITLNMNFPDTNEKYILTLQNGALTHTPDRQAQDAQATVTITRAALNDMIMRGVPPEKAIQSGAVKVAGSVEALGQLMSLLDKPEPWFNIVTP
jgi:alkyl sulfatase BDS1-like metallo-beta-lactamase superfamily hydrolase